MNTKQIEYLLERRRIFEKTARTWAKVARSPARSGTMAAYERATKRMRRAAELYALALEPRP